jgi:large subunit ribosomal protein L37e
MVKGTHSQGLQSKGKTHIVCRRCGKRTFHVSRKICASCGYGKSKRLRSYGWAKKKPTNRV